MPARPSGRAVDDQVGQAGKAPGARAEGLEGSKGLLEEARGLVASAIDAEQRDIGRLVVGSILARGLAERARIGDHIEDIIDHLEGQTDAIGKADDVGSRVDCRVPIGQQRLREPHAELALQSKVGITPTTARFYLKPQRRYFEALLDFIMVSPDLAARGPDWRIWHPFNDPGVMAVPELREALLQASDHFPVTIDLP